MKRLRTKFTIDDDDSDGNEEEDVGKKSKTRKAMKNMAKHIKLL